MQSARNTFKNDEEILKMIGPLNRPCVEQQFVSHDGAHLFYRHWASAHPSSAKKAIVLFHRGHEHSGRMQDVVDQLNLPDFDIFAWDARGHGRSDGVRGYAEHFGVLTQDVACFIHQIAASHGIYEENISIV